MRARPIRLTCLLVAFATSAAYAQPLTFTPATHAAARGARAAVAVDINRDGWLDIVTANTTTNVVVILVSRGAAGGFLAPRQIPVGNGPFDIAAGDFDRNGVPDLVVANPDAPSIELLLMNTNVTVRSRTIVSRAESRGLTVADWNRDGFADIVYSDYPRKRVAVLRGTGGNTFSAELSWGLGTQPQDVVVEDFNHDGFMDIAVANTTGTVMTVLEGTATTTVNVRSLAVGRSHNVLAAADINADGWLDLAAVSTATNVVSFLKGSRTGFTLAGTSATGSSPRGPWARAGVVPAIAKAPRINASFFIMLAPQARRFPDWI